IGIWAAAGGVGLVLGPVLGGLLLSEFGWHSVFLINVPVVALGILLALQIPESSDPTVSQFDPVGVALSVAGLFRVVRAVVQARQLGWGSATPLLTVAAAVTVLAGFVVWELRCAHPMMEVRFFRIPRFAVGNMAMVATQLAFAGAAFMLTLFLQLVHGY